MANDMDSDEMKAMIKELSNQQIAEKIRDMLTIGFEAEDEWSTQGITNKDFYGEISNEASKRGINLEKTAPF